PPGVAPWLPIGAENAARHVAAQWADPNSMLSLYRRLLAARRATPALACGSYRTVAVEGDLLAWEREHDGERTLVALNLGGEPVVLHRAPPGRVLVATRREREGEDSHREL